MTTFIKALPLPVRVGIVMHICLVAALVVLIGLRWDWLPACLVGAGITAAWTYASFQIEQTRREHEALAQRRTAQQSSRSGRFHDPDEAAQ